MISSKIYNFSFSSIKNNPKFKKETEEEKTNPTLELFKLQEKKIPDFFDIKKMNDAKRILPKYMLGKNGSMTAKRKDIGFSEFFSDKSFDIWDPSILDSPVDIKNNMYLWHPGYQLYCDDIEACLEKEELSAYHVFLAVPNGTTKEDIEKSKTSCTTDDVGFRYYFLLRNNTFIEATNDILEKLTPKNIHYDVIPDDNKKTCVRSNRTLPHLPIHIFNAKKNRKSNLALKLNHYKRTQDSTTSTINTKTKKMEGSDMATDFTTDELILTAKDLEEIDNLKKPEPVVAPVTPSSKKLKRPTESDDEEEEVEEEESEEDEKEKIKEKEKEKPKEEKIKEKEKPKDEKVKEKAKDEKIKEKEKPKDEKTKEKEKPKEEKTKVNGKDHPVENGKKKDKKDEEEEESEEENETKKDVSISIESDSDGEEKEEDEEETSGSSTGSEDEEESKKSKKKKEDSKTKVDMEKEKKEKEKEELEKFEKEKERLERERVETDKKAKTMQKKLEKEKVEREKMEKEKIEKKREEKARIEKEKELKKKEKEKEEEKKERRRKKERKKE